jgi:hypothetical protein
MEPLLLHFKMCHSNSAVGYYRHQQKYLNHQKTLSADQDKKPEYRTLPPFHEDDALAPSRASAPPSNPVGLTHKCVTLMLTNDAISTDQ